jgi:hypothetical protein
MEGVEKRNFVYEVDMLSVPHNMAESISPK